MPTPLQFSRSITRIPSESPSTTKIGIVKESPTTLPHLAVAGRVSLASEEICLKVVIPRSAASGSGLPGQICWGANAAALLRCPLATPRGRYSRFAACWQRERRSEQSVLTIDHDNRHPEPVRLRPRIRRFHVRTHSIYLITRLRPHHDRSPHRRSNKWLPQNVTDHQIFGCYARRRHLEPRRNPYAARPDIRGRDSPSGITAYSE